MKLENKNAIVTGAAKGMGAAITLTLAREGADVVLTARDTAALDEVAGELNILDEVAVGVVVVVGLHRGREVAKLEGLNAFTQGEERDCARMR